jgi:hypothetical protein
MQSNKKFELSVLMFPAEVEQISTKLSFQLEYYKQKCSFAVYLMSGCFSHLFALCDDFAI